MHQISGDELSVVTGGEGPRFQGQGKSTQAACFATIGRGVAHGYGLTGPWKPHSAMRPEHLMLDKNGNEAGSATWNAGQCNVTVY